LARVEGSAPPIRVLPVANFASWPHDPALVHRQTTRWRLGAGQSAPMGRGERRTEPARVTTLCER
jgi:hypothetical protein